MPQTRSESELREAARAAGQEHLFAFWDELDREGRVRLLEQIAEVDFDRVSELARLAASGSPADAGPASEPEPPELFPLERDADEERHARAARERGRELLESERVGFVLVAGGQASRLGYDGPKGDFPIGPVTRRSLFAFHARRLLAARRRHGCRTPWYVMTSRQNDAATRRIFAENDHFGLPAEDVSFFSQDALPALDDEGRILLAAKDELFLAPNGHGGVFAALGSSGALEDMRRRGLAHLSYFQVDNPLARPADPLFLGLHALAGARMSTKVVEKTDPDEKVGVLGRVDGRMGIIEYSDLSDELREARDPEGHLRFCAGNIAVHVIDVEFVEELCREGLELPWHLARKRMRVVRPGSTADDAVEEVHGTKFETFVFDALARSPRSVTLEVAREHEFSPVKNAEGKDSPATARADLCRLFSAWVSAAGLPAPPEDEAGLPSVEVDPLLAETEEAFLAAAPEGPRVLDRGHLYGE